MHRPHEPAPARATAARGFTGRARGLAALCALLPAACARAKPPLESAILITLDTTRADALGCYGGPAGVTPTLDALAREAKVYESARSVAPLTLPAHASMLTGLTPLRHGLRDNSILALPASATTITELAQERGLATAAFVSSVVLDRCFGLDQGFETYDQPLRPLAQTSSHFGERTADETIAAAKAWLAARERDRGFFLWIHLFDAHAPYAPPAELAGQARGNAYLGEVAAMDRALAELLAALRADGTLEHSLLVIAADHGESLGEHGEATHGAYCYEATLRVPLLVRDPADLARGSRSAAPVGLADLAPTIADALALGPLDCDGASLFRREPPAGRAIYFESYYGYLSYGWSPLSGCFDARAKYIHSSAPELYDPRADPKEERNLLSERAAELPRYREGIAAAAAHKALVRREDDHADAEMIGKLQAIGYTAGAALDTALPGPLEATSRPSPRDSQPELARTLAAMELSNQGRDAEVVPQLQQILAANAGNKVALDMLGYSLINLKRYAEAIEPLQKLLAAGPEWAPTRYKLGVAFYQTGQTDAAIEQFRRAVEIDAGHVQSLYYLDKFLEQRGQKEEAAKYRAMLERAQSK